jgi:hypothetical protein
MKKIKNSKTEPPNFQKTVKNTNKIIQSFKKHLKVQKEIQKLSQKTFEAKLGFSEFQEEIADFSSFS